MKAVQKIQPKICLSEEKLGFEHEGIWIVDPTLWYYQGTTGGNNRI